ncbi:recombinase family protein [Chromatium okenii]|nr:recombinase family protein [Chromatium okenii]
MATAIGYIRVSTSGQAIDGVSLDAQKAKIAAWAELNGYELGEIFEDAGISGTKQDRPGLAAALAAAKKGDAVIAYSISRFARSTKHLIEISESLAKREIDMVSISERIDTTSAAGKMVFRMMAVMAEFERDQVSERTKTALQHKNRKVKKPADKCPLVTMQRLMTKALKC